MNNLTNASKEDSSECGGVVIPNYPDDEEDEDIEIEESRVMDDQEYMRRTFKLCPKFTESPSECVEDDQYLYPEEIKGHILGAIMSSNTILDEGVVTALGVDNMLVEMTSGFLSGKRLAALLNECDAAYKNMEITLRNPLFKDIIVEEETAEGYKYRPYPDSSVGEMLTELRRCYTKKESEAGAQKRKREMQTPEAKILRMKGRNFLVQLMHFASQHHKVTKIKWQMLQTFYASIHNPEHMYHDVLYKQFEDCLELSDHLQLDQIANKHMFGKSKATSFLALAEFSEIILYEMIDNQLHLQFKQPLTPENCTKFFYTETDFELVHDRYNNAQAAFEEIAQKHTRKKDFSQPRFKEACPPSATSTYTQRLNQKNTEDVYYDSKNLELPFGTEAPKLSDTDFSTDEDDILSEKYFSDENEVERKEKEENKRRRQEAIAAKEARKQHKREQQRLQMQEAPSISLKSKELYHPNDSTVNVPTNVVTSEPAYQEIVRNKWEKSVSEVPEVPTVPPVLPQKFHHHSSSAVQPLFGASSYFSQESTPVPSSSALEKSLFGGPIQSDSIRSFHHDQNITSTTNHIESSNYSKPLNNTDSKYNNYFSSSSLSLKSKPLGSGRDSSMSSHSRTGHTYPLERFTSSCSISSTHRSGQVEEGKLNFLNFLRNHVNAFRSESSSQMRLMSNIAGSIYGHPLRLFGSKYLEIIQNSIPQIQIEDVETEEGYEVLFKWVEE